MGMKQVILSAAPLVLLMGVGCKKETPPSPAIVAPAPKPVLTAVLPRVEVDVTEEGFVPSRIPAKVGVPVTLAITRKVERTCATEIMFQGQEGKTELPFNQTVEVVYTPKAVGEIKFGCAMGMMIGGVVAVGD